ncbi:MAG: glycosyltransferase family 2 protein [Deltaproteobacteria bacterium]|nr:MAG: glycosyltransferase family 2 protein [Deltaproteobacteria bacterium]TMB24577.1 MAG: glycosyltransferase family 2 protein [Deltaproteobacteria bacterium]TME44998.1 MAG: glycosyltransferase family 2 protein [Chloroflexota bacterium]
MRVAAQLSPAAVELTVLMPCLDEAKTVATCVRKAIEACQAAGVDAEVLVADNGSRDGSPDLARTAGARVIHVEEKGYGAALRAGIEAARGRYVVMGDADDSYEFQDVPRFLSRLRAGDDLVMGSRFRGVIHPGAMPFLHRFLGNPVLTWILNLFFGAGISDAHCGMRGFSREAILSLSLRSPGMEFASEMVIRAAQEKLRIGEVPTSLRPDGRGRRPHLRTWRDGWRHLRFMLLFSPWWLFAVPGLCALVLGLALIAAVAFTEIRILGHQLHTHFALLGSALAILGTQILMLGIFAKALFVLEGIGSDPAIERLITEFRLEVTLALAIVTIGLGMAMDGYVLAVWVGSGGGSLEGHHTHLAVVGGTLLAVGVEVIFSAFFLSILRSSRTGQWT